MVKKIILFTIALLITQNLWCSHPVSADLMFLIPLMGIGGAIGSSIATYKAAQCIMPYGAQWGAAHGAAIGKILSVIGGSLLTVPVGFAIGGGLSLAAYKLALSLSKYYRHKKWHYYEKIHQEENLFND